MVSEQPAQARSEPEPEDSYRQQWKWDKVTWASHCVDCFPGNCPYRVYVKDGVVWNQEPAGTFPIVEEGVPDMNPMGCQKGAAWTRLMYGEERLLYPLKRVGERGAGKWKRISWDEAATEIADAVLDAIEEIGPESIMGFAGGSIIAEMHRGRFLGLVGGIMTDANAEVGDFAAGHYLTWGAFDPVPSIDDTFHAELILIWFANPVYTRIPHFHYIPEARYNGAEVYAISPDVSPSSKLADYHVPVRPGTDAALSLAMCRVVIDEGLMHEQFVKEQTDLPLLANPETGRFLRQSDLEEGGSEEQFYAWDERTGQAVLAPRGTLFWGDVEPALEGEFTVEGIDGPIAVTTVFAMMRKRLEDYSPEAAAEICDLHPEMIRTLARKIASKRTDIICGEGNASKHYHGDLMERSQLLLLALTGNWGRKGTGVRTWNTVGFMGGGGAGFDEEFQAAQKEDPTLTPAIYAIQQAQSSGGGGGMGMYPAFFRWYYHAGYKDAWQRREWHDPSMKREFDEYFQEALEKGWWEGLDYPRPEHEPRVHIESGGNAMRRMRGGSKMLLEHMWPKLTMAVTFDLRMSATALYSDIVLPVAHHYEKIRFGIPGTHVMNMTFCDKAVEPPDEAPDELEGFRRLAEALERRARERNFAPYKNAQGREYDLTNAHTTYTFGQDNLDGEFIADMMLRGAAASGTISEDASLEDIRREDQGYYRFKQLGNGARALAQAADVKPNETFAPFLKHTEEGEPFPTLTRRAQFLIDHEWFIEADEHLPRHKEPPMSGGDYPFQVSSGHNRWSIHALNTQNKAMLETHRGAPHLDINDRDAAKLGIEDNEEVRVYNDKGEFRVPVRIMHSARPGQVIMYNGFDNFQFANWQGPNDVEPGMVKWLHMAGGYGHLRHWSMQWQPVTTMRNNRVAIEKIR